MLQDHDVSSRLAQGLPAVDTIAEYVWASALLGYQQAGLTGQPGDVHGWYTTEDGLDLRALGADCTALTSVVASADEAARWQDAQLRLLPEVWQGTAAQSSREFLTRHAATSGHAVAALRSAADTLAQLRDSLWRAVDRKVEATVEIEGRSAPQRAAWLAAARTVRTGIGDRDTASELIDQEVKPFVANDIGGDWLAAMRAAAAAVAGAYDDAVAALRSGPVAAFAVPGELGPVWTPPRDTGSAPPAGPAAPASGAFGAPASYHPAAAAVPAFSPGAQSIPPAPAAPNPAPTLPAAAPLDPADPVVPPSAPPLSGSGAAPGLGGGLPDLGGGLSGTGLSGLGQQLADMFGGLIGSAGDATPPDLEDPFDETDVDGDLDEEPEDIAQEEDPEDEGEDGEITDDEEAAEDGEPPAVGEDEAPAAVPADEEAEPVAAPVVAAPAETVPPPPAAEPQAAQEIPGRTPCEIAADELPQVGG